jgi:hypothetical protein
MKPATAMVAPIAPRNLAPTQTVIPTMFGPGINWQSVKTSANFLLVHPSLLLDNDAARPNEPTTEAAQRDLEETEEQGTQRDPLAGAAGFHPHGHRVTLAPMADRLGKRG